jgi:hypothetical protein
MLFAKLVPEMEGQIIVQRMCILTSTGDTPSIHAEGLCCSTARSHHHLVSEASILNL